MKHLVLTFLTIAMVTSASAAEEWKSYFKNNEVEVLYRYSDCHDDANGIHQQKILLKFVNQQNKKVEVFYTKQLDFSKQAGTPDVRDFSVQLEPNATVEGTCTVKDNRLYIFSKQLNFEATKLEKFELKNIIVKPLQ